MGVLKASDNEYIKSVQPQNRKRKMKYEINGISLPFGGGSWNKKASAKEIFSSLLLFVESKRILVNPIEMEKKEWCIESVLEIKYTLVSVTESMTLTAEEKRMILNLVDACNVYLDKVQPMDLQTIIFKNGDKWEDLSFDNAMKKFRNSFKVEINKIETKYGLYFRKEIPDNY